MKIDNNQPLDLENFWRIISAKARQVQSSGKIPILITDLDGTLIDYSQRSYQIFQQALRTYDLPESIVKLVNSINPENYDYFPKNNLTRLGIPDQHIITQLTEFWDKHYFTNQYLHFDLPIPGALDFIANIASLDINIVYLTGRDEQNMGDGTRVWLSQHGLMNNNGKPCRLLMKTNLGYDNAYSKFNNSETISALGLPILIVDNEPLDIQTLSERFPLALTVLIETTNSGKIAVLPQNLLRLKNYIKINSIFKR